MCSIRARSSVAFRQFVKIESMQQAERGDQSEETEKAQDEVQRKCTWL